MTRALRKIPVARPLLDEREAEAARRVILSGWVTQGPEVAAFEKDFAELSEWVGKRLELASLKASYQPN